MSCVQVLLCYLFIYLVCVFVYVCAVYFYSLLAVKQITVGGK